MMKFKIALFFIVISVSIFNLITATHAQQRPIRFFQHVYFDEEHAFWVYENEIPVNAFRSYYNHWQVHYDNDKVVRLEYHSGEQVLSYYTFQYDSNDNETLAQQHMENRIIAYFQYEYNSNGNLNIWSMYRDEELAKIVRYNENRIRVLEECFSNGEVIQRQAYNDYGVLIRTETYYNGLPSDRWYYYNSNGQKIKTEFYDDDGNMVKYIRYYYSSNSCEQNTISRAEVFDETNNLTRYDLFIYDEGCNLIRRDQYNAEGQLEQSHYPN